MPPSAKRIIIAPLDWGMGHTTRCIPIIKALQELGHEIIFAGNEVQTGLIRRSFPQIDVRKLESYRVRYSKRALMFTLLWQLPRLLGVIRREHQWLRQLVANEQVDGIISDNRYGLWHRNIPSIILIHQLSVQTGMGAWADALLRRIHYVFLNRFSAVWIPDVADRQNLGGVLSHPDHMPERFRYIGWLSQFSPPAHVETGREHVLIVLSGPEPQRSMLADHLWTQAVQLKKKLVFIEGKEGVIRQKIPPYITHFSFADTDILKQLITNASLVICRSGYSTLMDLVTLGKTAVLIPTPGQTEQEYLAKSLAASGRFRAGDQKNFDLACAVDHAEREAMAAFAPGTETGALPEALRDWLSRIP